ncbi:MAG: Ig-like domain-containing protein, partial [Anaerostipes hadrus]
YMDQNQNSWTSSNRPNNTLFGLMDNQHDDIEMSKTGIDYSYFGGSVPSGENDQHTYHSYVYHTSCEGKLAQLLTTGVTEIGGTQDLDIGGYKAVYTQVSGTSDRTATYSYAELKTDDYITVTGDGVNTLSVSEDTVNQAYFDDFNESKASYGEIGFEETSDSLLMTFKPKASADYTVYLMKEGESVYSQIAMTKSGGSYTAELPVQYGEMAELYLVKTASAEKSCKFYMINRSEKTKNGYIFTTNNTSVTGYVSNTEENSYTIIDDRSSFTNGDYISVNDAIVINEETKGAMTDGELYSVASKSAEINYETVSWFRYKNGKWSKLESEISEEENDNIGVRTDISESGLYVLMAKKASRGSAKAVTNLNYTQKSDRDSVIVLHFNDGNDNTKYYNVYYSESDFTDKTEDTVVKRTFQADTTDIELDLYDRDRTVYLGVEAVLENGCRSELAKIKVTTEAADSDGDGIPDWYNDKYELWPEEGTEKDIANSDDDKDTLTNYEEYKGGSDPKNPNDPVHTTVIPVQSISLDKEEVKIEVGKTVDVSATIAPDNATNKNITWVIEDKSVATVK